MSIICFGEVLWDCLPAGLFLGGAPFNVAAHCHRLGRAARIVSAVGDDQLGAEIRRRMRLLGMDQTLLTTVDQATGTVLVELQDGQPSYEIVDDVAYDAIPRYEATVAAAHQAEAFVFGSLAQRHQANQALVTDLVDQCQGLTVFDVNLRPPHIPRTWIDQIAAKVDLIKLNDQELAELLDDPDGDLATDAAALADRYGTARVCVTAGGAGAGLYDADGWHWADAPEITVRDAVGAGDSFLACLIDGLLADRPIDDTLNRCVRLAAHVASSDGAIPDHPPGF